MSGHERIQVLLQLHHDGGLSDKESRELALHLEKCPECLETKKNMEFLKFLVRNQEVFLSHDMAAEPSPHVIPLSAYR